MLTFGIEVFIVMANNLLVFFVTLLCMGTIVAQNDSIVQLEEVILSDARLYRFSEGVKVRTLTDSLVELTNPTFTDMLRFNSSIYLKENGYGMVSSPSFRGTNAQHTAVIWNGININSPLTGQTDFGVLLPQNYDKIAIRSGGGSVQYGSGAIGGSIHLNNELNFEEHFENTVHLGYGSYDTKKLNYRASYGDDSFSLGFGMNFTDSANDYPYLETDQKNENGAFSQININANAGYFFKKEVLLKFHHNTFFGDRNLSGTLTAPSDDNYKDANSRSLLELSHFGDGHVLKVKAAHLFEKYEYYANKNRPEHSFGKVNTFIVAYDHKLNLGTFTINGLLDYRATRAEGSSLEQAKRNQFATTILMEHRPTDKLSYGLNIRKDWVNDFESPFLMALNGSYQIRPWYLLKLNASKNFRLPTFNDLYWLGAGNLDLVPETSVQMEMGQLFTVKNTSIELTAFYIDLDDMIQWRPDTTGLFIPQNIRAARQYGLETTLNYQRSWGKHQLKFTGGWTYTKSIDQETERQLIYVPLNKVNASFDYSVERFKFYSQVLFNSSVFTTTDHSNALEGYTVANIGGQYQFIKKQGLLMTLGLRVNNLFNKNYQNVAYRPMPNRNVLIQIIAKF